MSLAEWWYYRFSGLRWPLCNGPEAPRFHADGGIPPLIIPEPFYGRPCESLWVGAYSSKPAYPFTALTFPL